VQLPQARVRGNAWSVLRTLGSRSATEAMGGRFSREAPAAAPSSVIVEPSLSEALAAQKASRAASTSAAATADSKSRAAEAAADETIRKLSAEFEAERRAFHEKRAAEVEALEADTLGCVKRQVALLHSKYDFVRPEAKPRCTAEEQSVLDCYAARKGADALQCGPVVDAYSACARRVVDDLAASLAAAQQK